MRKIGIRLLSIVVLLIIIAGSFTACEEQEISGTIIDKCYSEGYIYTSNIIISINGRIVIIPQTHYVPPKYTFTIQIGVYEYGKPYTKTVNVSSEEFVKFEVGDQWSSKSTENN